MLKPISRGITFLRVGFKEIYGNFFFGPQGKGRPKIPLIGFGLFAIYGAYSCFKAGKIMMQIIHQTWIPWAMMVFGFSVWTVLFPAIVYLIDYPKRTKRTYAINSFTETAAKDGWPKIRLD